MEIRLKITKLWEATPMLTAAAGTMTIVIEMLGHSGRNTIIEIGDHTQLAIASVTNNSIIA